MSFELKYEMDNEVKQLVRTFCLKTGTRMGTHVLSEVDDIYGSNTARIYRVKGDDAEQALFIRFEQAEQITVTSYYVGFPYAQVSSDLYDGLCAICSSRFITEESRPEITFVHKFDTSRFADVTAAISRSRLHQYVKSNALAHDGKLTTVTQVIDYWKFVA
jgi:hypothetical protein